ncbi:hypothetical protein BJ322DRAFT_1019058 [Thelephora terrestris]|uniref:Uncharacterized protein n=1 Tax=Thelephora terrestris TaxID=56493 RepID=A0A9P6HJG5_9AGAM|nr:hypothetical protein BJ322DRAFT_1019058 [Thelephora terrestris]
MVAINGREVISRAVGVLNTQYRCLGEFFFGRPTTLSRSRSFVSSNLKRPIPKATAPPLSTARAEVTPSGQVSRRRKHGRVEPKGYNDLARDNSTLFIPGGFRKERPKKQPTRVKARAPEVNDEPIDCDPESCGEEGQWADRDMTVEEQVLVMRGLNDLILQKRALEKQFNVKAASGRVKPQTAERKAGSKKETKGVDKLREPEQKGSEMNRSSTWKDQRLAQLEKEKEDIKGRLARERIERQHSRYHRKLEEQQRRRESEEHWKQLREKDAKSAALREGHLKRENVLLQGDLQFKHEAYLRACNEREKERKEREEERHKRLRAEEDVRQWKELMEQYFPGGQLPQQQSRPQQHRYQYQSQSQSRSRSVQNQPPSPQAQFELYNKKWEVLRSGIDIDGTTKVHLISFSQIPWPVIDMGPGNLEPSTILPDHVVKFFLHPLRGEGKSRKSIAKDELRKWHSDKFDRIVLSKVREEDKRAAAEVAGMIARVLTDMKNFS